jgi:hypothetical protein
VVDVVVKVDVLLVAEDAAVRRVVPVDSLARVVVKALQLVLEAAVVADLPMRAAKAAVAVVAELRTQQEARVAKVAANREVSVVLEMPEDQQAGARER